MYPICEQELPIDKLVEKAQKLLMSRRIENLGDGIYNVIGDHGTYTVAIDSTGKVSCDCPGFVEKGRCSHSTAVILLTQSSGKKKYARYKQ